MAEQHEERKGVSWSDLLIRMVDVGAGAAVLTIETAQKMVDELVKRGQVTRDEGEKMVNRLMEAGREQRESMNEMVNKATERTLERMDLARRSEVEELRQRLAVLENITLGPTTTIPEVPGTISEEDMESA